MTPEKPPVGVASMQPGRQTTHAPGLAQHPEDRQGGLMAPGGPGEGGAQGAVAAGCDVGRAATSGGMAASKREGQWGGNMGVGSIPKAAKSILVSEKSTRA